MNNFDKDNEYSHSHEEFWAKAYKQYFPEMVSSQSFSNDMEKQLKGIDRELLMPDGKIIRIDEKLRRPGLSDILLEYVSNDNKGTPGWIEKDLEINYIAYGSIKSNVVFMFPWRRLQMAWRANKKSWKKSYPIIEADNNGYITISVGVPFSQIWEAMYVVRNVIED